MADDKTTAPVRGFRAGLLLFAAEPLHRYRIRLAGWMVRRAVGVMPAGATRDTLRTAILVWLKLVEAKINAR